MFRRYGVELDTELEEVRAELGFAPLPESLISEKSRRLRDSARALGHVWGAHDMLVDPKRCASGYSFDAIWRARSHIDQACSHGAELRNHARVERLLLKGDRAIGVEYMHSPALRWPRRLQAHADNIVIAAGELASPQLLRANGVTDVGQRGFFCNPGYVLYGVVPEASSADSFVGCMGGIEQEGVELGDANVPRFLHRLMMIGSFKPRHLVAYGGTLGIGVKVRDQVSGELDPEGRLRKHLADEDRARLQRGEQAAREILEHAGARHVFNFGLVSAGRVGGMVRINEHVDTDLQTRFRGLFVCDGSVIPDECRNPPAVTLLCLAKRLAKRIKGSTQGATQLPHK
jgi:choline dehydrogenase-like flavoprotein